MKSILYTIAFFALTLFSSCTHNNGDIGELFGTWKLQSITINNEIDTTYQNDIFWKYQASVTSMIKVNDDTHDFSDVWGTWRYVNDGSAIEFDYTHSDNDNIQGSFKYSPLPETHLPSNSIFIMDVQELNDSHMTLRYLSENDSSLISEYIYKFKKWAQ